MNARVIRILKPVVFVLCLVPLYVLVHRFRTDNLGSDPVATITHFTGDWAVYFLLGGLAITPVRRLSPKLGWLVRFRRMVGLYAFFYATLHLLTYIFLFSGFDLPGAFDNLKAHQFAAIAQKFRDVWPTMLDDLKKRTFIQIGLLAWFTLFLLAITSPQWVMQKMGGKSWQTLHRTVYGAAFLALLHYSLSVKKGNTGPFTEMMIFFALIAARPAWQWFDKRRRAAMPQPALRV
jgi:sulfoxide reductase heme-binding subunit YedZ